MKRVLLSYAELVLLVGCIFLLTSCKKFIEATPPINTQSTEFVYANNENAKGVLIGIYSDMGSYNSNLTLHTALLADELNLFNSNDNAKLPYYTNTITSSSSLTLWSDSYGFIYRVNEALQEINKSAGVTEPFKNQFIGECRFLRAYFYFQLVRLWGALPLITSTDYKANSLLSRSDENTIYDFIIADLLEAEPLLTDGYVANDLLSSSDERVHPNKPAAAALLARIYLQSNDWTNAEIWSSKVIENSKYSTQIALNDIYLKNSDEAIWQTFVGGPGNYSPQDASLFILPSTGPDLFGKPYYLNNSLVLSFEENDLRKSIWIDSVMVGATVYYYPFKYRIENSTTPVEYSMFLRLSEQYLIRAEARAQLNKITGQNSSESDINIIRSRAALNDVVLTDKASALKAIEDEIRHEFFIEYGQRWFGLTRMQGFNDITKKRSDEVMPEVSLFKGGTWSSTDRLLPVPQSEILLDRNLLPQNDGY